jgi:hypothetical protein
MVYELIVQTMGLKAVASVNKAILSPKEKYPLSIELENRSPISISDIKIHSNQLKVIQNIEKTKQLEANIEKVTIIITITLLLFIKLYDYSKIN